MMMTACPNSASCTSIRDPFFPKLTTKFTYCIMLLGIHSSCTHHNPCTQYRYTLSLRLSAVDTLLFCFCVLSVGTLTEPSCKYFRGKMFTIKPAKNFAESTPQCLTAPFHYVQWDAVTTRSLGLHK
jgi:hypothetical protein